jgi:hypothetical protein
VSSVWRPLFGPIEDHPLAVCDYQTVDRKDLVAVDLVFPHYVSELFKMWYNPTQKWYYLDRQMHEEVWLVKMCDSGATEDNGIAECELLAVSHWLGWLMRVAGCPHASFIHPLCPPDARLRESIEMRALVFG